METERERAGQVEEESGQVEERENQDTGGDFPSGPVVRTPRSQCKGCRFNPW